MRWTGIFREKSGAFNGRVHARGGGPRTAEETTAVEKCVSKLELGNEGIERRRFGKRRSLGGFRVAASVLS
jgi:hypothetical protein